MRLATLVLTALVILASSCLADGISVSQSLEKATVAFEDSTVFEIKLQWDGSQASYRFKQPLETYFDRLRVGGFTSSIAASGSGSDEITTKTYRYTLIPTSAGLGKIDPIVISYITRADSAEGELVTEAMTVQIREPVPVEKEKAGVSIWLIVVIAAIVVVVIVVVVVVRSKRKADGPSEQRPTEKALDELALLKQEADSDMKKFQSGLHRLLIDFLAAQYSIKAEGLNEADLSAAFEGSSLSSSQIDKLVQLMVVAEKDKFRPVISAPGDTIRLESEVRELLSKL